MPGPKPDVRVAFERIYHELSRIGRACKTPEQTSRLRQVIEEVRASETLWFNPDIDTFTPRSVKSNKTKPEHIVDRLSSAEKAEIQQAARDAYDAGDYANPYPTPGARRFAWQGAWDERHTQENQSDVESDQS